MNKYIIANSPNTLLTFLGHLFQYMISPCMEKGRRLINHQEKPPAAKTGLFPQTKVNISVFSQIYDCRKLLKASNIPLCIAPFSRQVN